jgi:hypothetical protein
MTVHKEVLPMLGETKGYKLPEDYKILKVDFQKGIGVFWYAFEEKLRVGTIPVVIRAIGTGIPEEVFPEDYLGTLMILDDKIVIHYFKA